MPLDDKNNVLEDHGYHLYAIVLSKYECTTGLLSFMIVILSDYILIAHGFKDLFISI